MCDEVCDAPCLLLHSRLPPDRPHAAQVSRPSLVHVLIAGTLSLRRYFDDLADNVKPGVISERLRQAIGLDDDKLPIWIYRMRVLGYPPGWLKIADMSQTIVPLVAEAGDLNDRKEVDRKYTVVSERDA